MPNKVKCKYHLCLNSTSTLAGSWPLKQTKSKNIKNNFSASPFISYTKSFHFVSYHLSITYITSYSNTISPLKRRFHNFWEKSENSVTELNDPLSSHYTNNTSTTSWVCVSSTTITMPAFLHVSYLLNSPGSLLWTHCRMASCSPECSR